jgi:hypothetical protein
VAKNALRRVRKKRQRTQDKTLPSPFLRKAKVVGKWINKCEKVLRKEYKKRRMFWTLIGFLIMLGVALAAL